ncbi:MAG: TatD family hydrolase, partial [Cyanobium sp. MAG06]|nr:TatD family hydrolase [Cyanobium sp. MAG06]
LFDFHSHLHDKAFDNDRDIVIQNMKENNIYTITIGTDIIESRNAARLASENYNIYSSIGVHPADIRNAVFDEDEFQKIIDEYNDVNKYEKKNIICIGECGLDYYQLDKIFSNEEEIKKEKLRQDKLFRQQISFAIKNKLPLMLHGRAGSGDDAYIDMINILSEYKNDFTLQVVGNAHFFVGSIDVAKGFLELGFTFSIGGVLTVTNDYDELYRYIPLDKINIETDSPYVAPKDKNGQKVNKRNSPEYIEIILDKLADIRDINKEELRIILLNNIKNNYNLL